MIGYLEGKVVASDGAETIVKVDSGVGYQVVYNELAAIGKSIQIYVTSIYREDGQTLFGFKSLEDKKFFELLLKVKGVGPKTAYNLMSCLGPEQITIAVQTDSKSILNKVPGVGAKAAAQIILDLSGKIGEISLKVKTLATPLFENEQQDSKVFQETVMALKELGYKENEFNQVVMEKFKTNQFKKPEQLLQEVLRSL